MDSHLCLSRVNVIINIPQLESVFGIGLASTGEEHRSLRIRPAEK